MSKQFFGPYHYFTKKFDKRKDLVGVPKEPIPEPEPEPEEGPFYRNIPYREYHPYRNEGEEYKQRRMVKTMRQFRVDSMPYEQDQKDILIDQLQQKMKSKERELEGLKEIINSDRKANSKSKSRIKSSIVGIHSIQTAKGDFQGNYSSERSKIVNEPKNLIEPISNGNEGKELRQNYIEEVKRNNELELQREEELRKLKEIQLQNQRQIEEVKNSKEKELAELKERNDKQLQELEEKLMAKFKAQQEEDRLKLKKELEETAKQDKEKLQAALDEAKKKLEGAKPPVVEAVIPKLKPPEVNSSIHEEKKEVYKSPPPPQPKTIPKIQEEPAPQKLQEDEPVVQKSQEEEHLYSKIIYNTEHNYKLQS